MNSEIHGYVIINKFTKERWGSLYNSEQGAKQSWNKHRGIQDYKLFQKKIDWNDQQVYVLYPLFIGDYWV